MQNIADHPNDDSAARLFRDNTDVRFVFTGAAYKATESHILDGYRRERLSVTAQLQTGIYHAF